MLDKLLCWLKAWFVQDEIEEQKIMALLSDVKAELGALQGSLDELKTVVEAGLNGVVSAADLDEVVADVKAKKAEVDALVAELTPAQPE